MRGVGIIFAAVCLALFASSTVATQVAWSETIGQQYLYYAYAAYCNHSQVEKWECKWCQESSVSAFVPTAFPYDPVVNGYGFVGYNDVDRAIVVSFRGTEASSLRNWIIDLSSAKLVPYKDSQDVQVGKGFYTEWTKLMPEVMDAVTDLRNKTGYDIYVTGHSLGAAISMLCALELVEAGFENVFVYNYGCPRVGNPAFSVLYNNNVPNTYRVVNGKDLVPHSPPQFLGFQHAPTEVWENPAGGSTFKVCSTSNGEDPKCSNSVILPDSVYDHLHYYDIFESCD